MQTREIDAKNNRIRVVLEHREGYVLGFACFCQMENSASLRWGRGNERPAGALPTGRVSFGEGVIRLPQRYCPLLTIQLL